MSWLLLDTITVESVLCSSRGVRLIDINAHSRSITDVDIAMETGLVSYNSNMAILYSSWFFIAPLFSFRV